ncbi:hypothetical protein HK099_001768, partial [Clydaea vesicula]
CDRIFEHESETYEHCLEAHSISGKQLCQWTSNSNFGSCGHKYHFSVDFRPLQCHVCLKRIRSRQELNRHSKTHTKLKRNSKFPEDNISSSSSEVIVDDFKNKFDDMETTTSINNDEINNSTIDKGNVYENHLVIGNDYVEKSGSSVELFNLVKDYSLSTTSSECSTSDSSSPYDAFSNISTDSYQKLTDLTQYLMSENFLLSLMQFNNTASSSSSPARFPQLIPNVENHIFNDDPMNTTEFSMEKKNSNTDFDPFELKLEELKNSLSHLTLDHLRINLTNPCHVGTNLGMFWINFKAILEKFQINVPEGIKTTLVARYLKDGAMGRITHQTRQDISDVLLSDPNYNFSKCIEFAKIVVPENLWLIYQPFITKITKELIATIKVIFKEGLQVQSINSNTFLSFQQPNYNPNYPYRRLLITIVKVVKSNLEVYLSNEDKLLFFQPNDKSSLFRPPSDCTASAILLHYKFAFPAVSTYEKTFLESLRNVTQMGIDELVKKMIFGEEKFGEICRKTCCFGFLCTGIVRFNWDFFGFENESYLWMRLGNDEQFVFKLIEDLNTNIEPILI